MKSKMGSDPSKMESVHEGMNLLQEEQILSSVKRPHRKGRQKIKNGRVALSENEPIHLKTCYCISLVIP